MARAHALRQDNDKTAQQISCKSEVKDVKQSLAHVHCANMCVCIHTHVIDARNRGNAEL